MADQNNDDVQFYKIEPSTPITQYISKGQIIELEIKLGLFAGQYRSRVMDFGGKYIKILVPKVDGKEKFIWKDTTIHINYMRPDAMFTFKVKVRKSELNPMPNLLVTIPPQVERVQRRRYVRVDTLKMETKFRIFNEEISIMDDAESFNSGKIVNISAGGMRIDHDDIQIPKGEVIELEFTIMGFKCQRVLGEIVRSIELTKKDRYNEDVKFYSHGINFIQIHRVQKEKIFGYVFQKEREMLSKGLK